MWPFINGILKIEIIIIKIKPGILAYYKMHGLHARDDSLKELKNKYIGSAYSLLEV